MKYLGVLRALQTDKLSNYHCARIAEQTYLHLNMQRCRRIILVNFGREENFKNWKCKEKNYFQLFWKFFFQKYQVDP
jgi:hypothetical protein